MLGGGLLEGVHLVLEHGAGEVEVHRPLPVGAPARGAPAVGDDDGEALVGEPLRREVGEVRAHGAQGVGAAVGVEQHRQRRAVVVLGQHERGGEASHAVERGTRRVGERLGTAANDCSETPSRVSHDVVGSPSVAVRITTVGPPAAAACTPGSSVSASSAPPGRRRQTCSTVASSIGLARNTMPSAPAATTARTWRSVGVTGTPSTTRRRAPPKSVHVNSAPPGP